MSLSLKSLLFEKVSKDKELNLQIFLSSIFLKVLETKQLIKPSLYLFNTNGRNYNITSKYLKGLRFLNENFDNFYILNEIKNKISPQILKEISDLLLLVKEDDWKIEEIISWSYEYYNNSINDKNNNLSQFYTPKWIADYLIENSLNNYFRNNPDIDVQSIKIIDPACGCGNFILRVYDYLRDIYLKKGYSKQEAAKIIISNNLYGFDVDSNSVEITNLLLKLKSLEDEQTMDLETNITSLKNENEKNFLSRKLSVLGSLIKKEDVLRLKEKNSNNKTLKKLLDILSSEYDIVLTNPPYIDSSDYSPVLKDFINKDYKDFRKNLYSCFIRKSYDLVKNNGYVGMITPQTFMFISSYEQTRKFILENFQIEKLVHFGLGGVFESALVDTTMFVLKKGKEEKIGEYINLTDVKGKDAKKEALYKIWKEKDELYISKYVHYIDKEKFLKIPRIPFIYWVDPKIIETFEHKALEKYAEVRQGIATGDNQKFLRYFWEVKREDISFNHIKDGKKWVPYTKGGPYNNWYGNLWWVIAFDEENYNLLSKMGNKLPNRKYYFREGITYTMTTSKGATFRYLPPNFIFDCKGSSIFFSDKNHIFRFLALLNSSFFKYLEKFIAGSVDLEVGDLKKIPIPESIFKNTYENETLENLSRLNVAIKKQNLEIFPTELHFNDQILCDFENIYNFIESKNILDTYLLLSEGLIDTLVYNLYGLERSYYSKIYNTVDLPVSFYPLDSIKDIESLPSLRVFLNEEFACEMGLNAKILENIEKSIKHFYITNLKEFPRQQNDSIRNHNREQYINYIKTEAEILLKNPLSILKNIELDENLKELAYLKIDRDVQKYLLQSNEGFIPLGFSKESEDKLMNLVFDERKQIERIIKKEIERYLINNYPKNHEKLYKNRPLIWKIGNKKYSIFLHYHNINQNTKKNIINFLKKQLQTKEIKNLINFFASKNFDINFENGVLKNKEAFFEN